MVEEAMRHRSPKLRVIDPTPTGDVILDDLLRRMIDLGEPMRAERCIFRVDKYGRYRGRLRDRLVTAGHLRLATHWLFGVLPTRRVTSMDVGQDERLRDRLRAIIRGERAVDARLAAVAILGREVGLVDALVPPAELEAANDRIKSLGWGRGLTGFGLTEAQAAALAEVRSGVSSRVMDANHPNPPPG
jgi:hypothetical protein